MTNDTELKFGIRLLETLTAALYEDPIVLFREYVQNSADSSIRNPISEPFNIEINVDKKNKTILFRDNGYGIDAEDFYSTMKSIGRSDKSQRNDQIGFRGIGRLAAMPFCKVLKFKNKVKGHSCVQWFAWHGDDYSKLLQERQLDDLQDIINNIIDIGEDAYNGSVNEHFFEVEINGYSEAIDYLVSSDDFEKRLSLLLPLGYSPDFNSQKEIHEHFNAYMSSSFEKFEFNVSLNGKQLYKPFKNNHILESGIIYWDLVFSSNNKSLPGEKIGVLWFTFNRKVTANPPSEPRGIWVRSKNMLMGNENAIVDAVSKVGNEYITTRRDLIQTISGLYGELLIDTSQLSDNARRDWFKIDKYSIELQKILIDFLKKVKDYRRSASAAFNDTKAKQKKEKAINSFKELTGGVVRYELPKDFKDEIKKQTEHSNFNYADEDIPHNLIDEKRIYDRILRLLRKYFEEERKNIDEFLRIRAYLKKYYQDSDLDI